MLFLECDRVKDLLVSHVFKILVVINDIVQDLIFTQIFAVEINIEDEGGICNVAVHKTTFGNVCASRIDKFRWVSNSYWTVVVNPLCNVIEQVSDVQSLVRSPNQYVNVDLPAVVLRRIGRIGDIATVS